jgi:hypothetical protein
MVFSALEAAAQLSEDQPMTTSVKQMMDVANAEVPKITPAQAQDMIAKGNTLNERAQ